MVKGRITELISVRRSAVIFIVIDRVRGLSRLNIYATEESCIKFITINGYGRCIVNDQTDTYAADKIIIQNMAIIDPGAVTNGKIRTVDRVRLEQKVVLHRDIRNSLRLGADDQIAVALKRHGG